MKNLIIISVLFLSACTANKNYSKTDIYQEYLIQNQLKSLDKIKNFTFRGWNSLDTNHLILSGSHNKFYLIELYNSCNDLNYTNSIILDQAIDHTLSVKFDAVIIPNQNFQNKCRITSIHEINKEQRNELTALRKSQKH